MAIELSKQDVEAVLPSLRKYCKEELELELGDMGAKFLLDYFLKEVAPFAYNQGVSDAERYLRDKIDDLSGACFEVGMTYWLKKKR